MPRLPAISGKEAIKAFERLGYERKRQRGSHVVMSFPGRRPIVVPEHGDMKRGTLRSIIRDSGFTVEEFLEAL
ncbi:MAG: type II toxin-antitoxin system HicA family toxin [Rubrobacter sp.]|nr:type II toxin-antitoxin system HicA family toxin [Rubrobacter sp.]